MYHASLQLKIPDLPSSMTTQQVEEHVEELKKEVRRTAELWLAKKFTSPPPSLTVTGVVILKDFS